MTTQSICKCSLAACLAVVFCLLIPMYGNCEDPVERVEELETGFYYTVQKGDTLWDLSHHFFDSPWIWPDLWGKNQDLSNPHWIYPGDRIRLYKRSGTESSAQQAPVLQMAASRENQTETEKAPYFFYPAIDTVGFVRKHPVQPSGTIFSVKEDKFMISTGDLVYVRSLEGAAGFQTGDRYTIYRTKALQADDARDFGIQHYLVGLLKITDVKSAFSVAKIVESYRHIETDDLLMPYTPRSKKIELVEKKQGLEGKIVAAEEGQVVFADHTIVFVNKGYQDGVRNGQIYNAYYRRHAKPTPDGKPILLSPVNFGKFIVLHTEPTTATAVVTMAEKSIEPGTKFH